MLWTRSVHLVDWADTLDARSQLPLLIRKLVRRTVGTVQTLNFPAGEQTWRPGFDGEAVVVAGNQFVPAGSSKWEMGVDGNPKGKADEDFRKRTDSTPVEEQKTSAFVFVTPRVWVGAKDWAKEKRATSSWRDVIALDANDLEHWLELAHDVDIWFGRITGRVPPGVQDLESYWLALRSIAEHALVERVFSASRDNEVAIVSEWLSGSSKSLFLRSDGLYDGLDFLAALSTRAEHERLTTGVIVHTAEAWRELAATTQKMILIAAPTLELQATDISAAMNSGHHVFSSGPRRKIASELSDTLRRQDHYSIAQALIESGYSEARARSLGTACCGSSSILKRLIVQFDDRTLPEWSRLEQRARLAPFALVGGWKDADLWMVSEFVGCSQNEVEECVVRWCVGSEPLFIRLNDSVLVASREESWYLLGGSVSRNHLDRFREAALLVLEEDNPAFQLPADQRWMANLYGKTHSLSEDLRRSIVETLALMATYPTADGPDANTRFTDTVLWVLEKALPEKSQWERWASFGRNLPIVAEAAPDFFLSRVEADLSSDDPALPQLFQDQSDSFFVGAIHSNLLWALEGLAWSSDYLRRVSICLAKLAARDPGGTYANRPAHSLHEIFLWWLWHTNASQEERIEALSAVLAVEPAVGWKLLVSLLPQRPSELSDNTHMPRWRPWADGWSRRRLQPQIRDYQSALAKLTVETAGIDPQKWSKAIDGILRVDSETTAKVFVALERICEADDSDPNGKFKLWNEIRELVSRHERYPNADWVFHKSTLTRLATIRDRLEPNDAVLALHWLFNHDALFEIADDISDMSASERKLEAARLDALQRIITQSGVAGVFRVIELASDPSGVGWLVGRNRLLDWSGLELPKFLDGDDRQQSVFVSAFIRSRFDGGDWAFVDQIPFHEWTSSQIAAFARALPFQRDVWEWVSRFGNDVVSEYWRFVRPFLTRSTLDELDIAAKSLVAAGRAFTATVMLTRALYEKLPVPSQLVAEVLEAGIVSQNTDDTDEVSHSIERLVKALQDDNEFDRARLARIEWAYLRLLEPEFSETGPVTLVSEINSDPRFFVELLKKAYRGKNDPPDDESRTALDAIMAEHAHRLFSQLEQLPGTSGDGTLDYDFLRNWITKVHELANECGRRAICDIVLGELFARASERPDELWPVADVAILMEQFGNDDFFDGFVTGTLNSRGVVSRDPMAGGGPERQLADRNQQLASNARPNSRRLADAFLQVARHYETDAGREDDDSQRRRLGR